MNKGERQAIAQSKYVKRLKKISQGEKNRWDTKEIIENPRGISKEGVKYNFTGLKHSSAPCSCYMCTGHKKYNRAKEKRNASRESF